VIGKEADHARKKCEVVRALAVPVRIENGTFVLVNISRYNEDK